MDQAEPSAAAASEPGKPTIVVKIGTSSLLSADGATLALSTIASIVEVLADLRQRGHGVVLVSSGAVGVGCQRLGLKTRPTGLAKLQALAAIGMPRLMHHYETLFSTLNQPIAQVLLSADALDSSSGYANVQQTIVQLLALGVIPIVNENNAVSISELRFGDNDTLSALVALMVGAEHLFLATDVDALYTSNPTAAPTPGAPPARPIREVTDVAQAIKEVEAAEGSNAGSQWGTGGIATKLRAAQLAGAAGVTTVIISAKRPQDIATILGGATDVGTRFNPNGTAVRSHKRWIMALPAKGSLQVRAGPLTARGHDTRARGPVALSAAHTPMHTPHHSYTPLPLRVAVGFGRGARSGRGLFPVRRGPRPYRGEGHLRGAGRGARVRRLGR